MGIYTNTSIVLGVRILQADDNLDYYVTHTFIGESWKECASEFLEKYSKTRDIKIQTLHNCTTTFSPDETLSSKIWIDNPDFTF